MSSNALNIVIVGGGTAGWLSAMMMSNHFRNQRSDSDSDTSTTSGLANVTVVESSAIPSIGVGEGTTAVFGSLLRELGIDEAEFLTETGATIKYGIKHRDWRRLKHTYDGPIDDPHQVTELVGNTPWLDVAAIASGKPLSHHHLFHYLLNLNKAPIARQRNKSIAVGPFQYAYHFDQAKVGSFLRSKSSVKHIDATVQTVERNETGDITAIVSDNGQRIIGDFFIDCTGFRKQLVREHKDYAWISYADQLPVNRAMPFWLSHKSNMPIPPYTLAWAQQSGWMWSIPTQERIGYGYVYCDAFTTPELAQLEIESVLGQPIEPRNDLKFDSGRLQESWLGNCIALGLSSSFLEPLEATSIHATVVQLMLLLRRHVCTRNNNLEFIDREAYNDTVAKQVDGFRDFVNLHYVSERDDSEFWRHVSADCISPYNRERIERWAHTMPRRDDFEPMPFNLPHVEDQLYYPVLDGLGLLCQSAAKNLLKENPAIRRTAKSTIKELGIEFRQAAAQAMDHGIFLNTRQHV